jgi:DNA-binding MarR family transcriptional regulator
MQSVETAGSDRLAGALDERLAAVWRYLMRGSTQRLSRTSTSVLALLRDRGPQRITALAVTERVAQPSMTALVARLERDGYVTRSADPADGRAALIELTDAGRDVLARLRSERAALLDEQLAGLGDDDRARLEAALPALDALIDNLKGAE